MMMEQMTNPTNTATDTKVQSADTGSYGGIDDVINQVEEYIQNPSLATRQTLSALKADLLDLKDYFDSEESSGDANHENSQSSGGISAMMNKTGGSQ